ncbi:DNA (cytosine-5-)-methyltransferase [Deltaproteobacteria bacterium OttesenSCG-928-M10]|nr:DNA (cytosine-5-)-methyltransferase [Deltaproteobacteria bacterium OttesenSCG-928-M10]
MRYLSLCSGIEAATVAWKPLRWKAVAFSEINKFSSAVLAYRYPHVPNLGDMLQIKGRDFYGHTDLMVAGTPCQTFSSCGQRKGLADPRGQLTLSFLDLLDRVKPRWFIWENVPHVMHNDQGRTFGTILWKVAQLRYGFAYRCLDAQYFHLVQRRERLFLVGHRGDWRPAAAVLFERHSLSGDSPPRRQAQTEIAGTFTSGAYNGGAGGRPEGAAANHFLAYGGDNSKEIGISAALTSRGQRIDFDTDTFIANTLRGEGFDGSEDGTGRANLLPMSIDEDGGVRAAVRRLTPKEAERLMGFEDDYTLIPWRGRPADKCPDGPRYMSIGNSMPVPVMYWLGRRVELVDKLLRKNG